MLGLLLIALLSVGTSVATADPVQMDSLCAPQPALARAISKAFVGWQVVTAPLLEPHNRTLFEADHPGACPGVAQLDFFGDALPATALSLVKGTQARLVLARQPTRGMWSIKALEQSDGFPVLWVEKRGVYSDVYGERKLTVAREGVVWCGYESWAILYASVGGRLKKIWLAD